MNKPTTNPAKNLRFTRSNNPDAAGLWHIGIRKELRGEKTGKLFATYWPTLCRGKQLGGAWGQDQQEFVSEPICAVCEKRALKHGYGQ